MSIPVANLQYAGCHIMQILKATSDVEHLICMTNRTKENWVNSHQTNTIYIREQFQKVRDITVIYPW
jgi:hypothetical protein